MNAYHVIRQDKAIKGEAGDKNGCSVVVKAMRLVKTGL